MADGNTPKVDVSRRDFIKKTSVAVAGAGIAMTGTAAARETLASCDTAPKEWDETVDVVVVGSGFAGLSAAIEARNVGADVLVIEKMPVHGGNSIVNGGDFAAAGNKMQKAAGIQDSAELMLKDMLKAGAYLNHVELAKMVADRSNETLEWAEQYVGAQFTRLNYHGGHSVKRACQTINGSGSELVNKLLAKGKSLGVKLTTRTKLVRLLSDKDRRIVGVEVRRGYRFPDESSGKLASIRARRAVVLASGGFSQNVALRQIHDPRITEKFESTNHPGATGEALLAACSAGAMDVQMDWIQLGPWTSPDERGFGHTPQFCERIVGYGLMVDPKTGKRFFKETGNRKERADAILLVEHPVVILGDSNAVAQQVTAVTLRKGMEIGAIKKFDTLEALAKAYEMPTTAFLEEVARWNGFIEKKKDPDFGCMIFPDAKPTATAPFYAARLWPKVHHTMGGLVINREAQVIGFDLKPVEGLYAAGEVTGGVHGAVRLGSVAMADCVVFGRIAGRNAGKEKA